MVVAKRAAVEAAGVAAVAAAKKAVVAADAKDKQTVDGGRS